MFWQHNPDEPIGKWLDMAEDGKGLFVEGQLNMGVQRAREAYALLKEGDIDGLSIGYGVVTAEPDAEKNVLRLKELRLVEVSIVSLAANDRARVDSVKAAEIDNLRIKLLAGDRLTEREWESLFKSDLFGMSNSQAERAVRVNLKRGQGEPDDTAEPAIKAALPDLRAALDGFLSRT
jgi:HK97 family phage prohead protease